MKVRVCDIRANPHRDIGTYKLNEEILIELRESVESTGFWDNLLCRKSNGHIECAYGHHRLAALKNTKGFGPKAIIDVAIKDLTDADMLRIMYRENHDVYGGRVDTTLEGVKKVVEGYAKGLWDLPKPGKMARSVRNAPRYCPDKLSGQSHPYTAESVAQFLGVEKRGTEVNKIKFALQALQAIEDKVVTRANVKGLTSKQAAATVREARRAERVVTGKMGSAKGKRAARTVATKVAGGMRGGKHGYLAAKSEAKKVVKTIVPKGAPWIDDMAREVGQSLQLMLTSKTDTGKKIDSLVKEAGNLNTTSWNRIVDGLTAVEKRAKTYLEDLNRYAERKSLV